MELMLAVAWPPATFRLAGIVARVSSYSLTKVGLGLNPCKGRSPRRWASSSCKTSETKLDFSFFLSCLLCLPLRVDVPARRRLFVKCKTRRIAFQRKRNIRQNRKSFVRVFPSRILHCFFKLKKLGKRRFLEKTKVCYFVDETENVRIRF